MDIEKNLSAFEVYDKKQKNIEIQLKKLKYDIKVQECKKIKRKKNVRKLKKLNVKNIHSDKHKLLNKTYLKNISKLYDNMFLLYKYNLKKNQLINLTSHNIQRNAILADEKEEFDKIYLRIINKIDKYSFDPIKETEKVFEWLIYPLKKQEFFENNWEKIPLHIRRNKSKYYKSLISTPLIDKILRDNYILFSTNLDITSFTNNVRETHNPIGRALPSIVWDYFANGCSVRLLNPHTYISKLHILNFILQEFFGSFVGANIYLTPPNSQGFAPHYDDIEAFVLQIEGKKRWRLYKPRNNNEFLARYSSPNFSQKEIGKPILDTIVNAGDLLYFPRGTIHQGDTFGFENHSLHITLSVYQKNSWGDFFEKLVPLALKIATENDVRFRKGLPLNYLRHIGTVYSKNLNDTFRQEFSEQTKYLFNVLLMKYINIDKTADEMAKNHIHDFLPPILNSDETLCSIYEGGERMIKNGLIVNRIAIKPNTFVRLTRSHCVRLVEENGLYRLYYSCENSKEYHEYELQFFEIDLEFVSAIQKLILEFPRYTKVNDLPINKLDKKLLIVRDLWEKAIIISKKPLLIFKN